VIPYLSQGVELKRFFPLASLLSFVGLVALGRQLDATSAIVVAVFIPFSAYALSLLFVPVIRILSSPDRILLKLSQDVTKDYAKKYQIPRRRRERIRQLLVTPMRPSVADQMEEFWAVRLKAKDSQFDKELERQEIGLVSLAILGGYCFMSGLGSWLLASSDQYRVQSYESIRAHFIIGFALILPGAVFLFAFERERITYQRLLWEKLPLLVATTGGLDAEYWGRRKEFVETNRDGLGDGVANRLVEEAEERYRLVVKGEFASDWIRQLLERQASEDSKIAEALLPYVLRAQGATAPLRGSRTPAVIVLLLSSAIVLALVAAADSGQPILLAAVAPLSAVTLVGLVFLLRAIGQSRASTVQEHGK